MDVYCEEKKDHHYVDKRVMVVGVPGKRRRGRPRRCGWIASGTTCRRENCQERKRKTDFNGGVS